MPQQLDDQSTSTGDSTQPHEVKVDEQLTQRPRRSGHVVEFNFYDEFYKSAQKNLFYLNYESSLLSLVNNFYADNVHLESFFNPTVSGSCADDDAHFRMKLTIDAFLPIVGNKYTLASTSSSKLLESDLLLTKFDTLAESNNNKCTNEDETRHVPLDPALNTFYNLLLDVVNLGGSCRPRRLNELESTNENITSTTSFLALKGKLRGLLNFKLNFLTNELGYVMGNVESNNKLGQKVRNSFNWSL